MKKLLTIFLILLVSISYSSVSDTVMLSSKIKDVTVFFDGAQITQKGKLSVGTGKHIVVIDKLPAELNPKSIQVSTNQKGKILSVKHLLTHPSENNSIIKAQEEKIKQEEIKIKYLNNKINVLTTEEKILLDNSNLNREKGTTIEEIKAVSVFYRQRLGEIKDSKLKLELEKVKIKEKIQDLYMDLNKKISEVNKSFSKIIISLDCKKPVNAGIEISYFVTSAGWSPIYDFRVMNVTKPLNLIYNAIIYQSTGEDWNNVNLTLSTNRPSLSNDKPSLEPWYLNRRKQQRVDYSQTDGQSALKGAITDTDTGEPIPFANIVIYNNNSQIGGATSDFDGNFTIKPVKSGTYDVKATFVGYKTELVSNVSLKENQITFLDLEMESSAEMLESVNVVSYKVPLIDKDNVSSGTTITSDEIRYMPNRSSRAIATTVGGVSKKQSNIYLIDGKEANKSIVGLEYNIEIPYSIPSDGNDYTVKIKEISLPANYIYYSVPKLEADVFLTSEIPQWSELDILSGISSIYYNGVFTGETYIDAKGTSDTLSVSLNRDRDVMVERKLLKEKNEKQFLGKNTKELINWNITAKNNKAHSIKLIIEDQLPISDNKAVQIEAIELSGAKYNEKTGMITWTLELDPNEKLELDLIYWVKYPNYMTIITE